MLVHNLDISGGICKTKCLAATDLSENVIEGK
jgi:hypothetical protein